MAATERVSGEVSEAAAGRRPAGSSLPRGEGAGIVAFVVALGFAGCMDALVKLVGDRAGLGEVMVWRSFGALALLAPVLILAGRWRRLVPRRWGFVFLRGALLGIGTALFFYGLGGLTLPVAYTITFTMPLMLSAMAVVFLGERLGRRNLAAIALGFLGVMVALDVRPWDFDDSVLSWHAAAALLATALYAAALMLVRIADQEETTEAMVTGALLAGGAVALVLLPFDPLTSSAQGDWLLLAGIALAAVLSQLAVTQAFRWAPATRLAPFEYTVMIWGILFGVLIWGDWPSLGACLGGGLVIVASTIAVHR
ncbi:MAG: DMT family transporter [Azospirillaceae bacterium]